MKEEKQKVRREESRQGKEDDIFFHSILQTVVIQEARHQAFFFLFLFVSFSLC